MKTMELRYTNDHNGKEVMAFKHSAIGHELGEVVLTEVDKAEYARMSVISQETEMTEEGYKLVCTLYRNYKGKISKRIPNRFEHKVRLAIRIMASIGRLSTEDQIASYQAYCNKLAINRDVRFVASMRKIERLLATL